MSQPPAPRFRALVPRSNLSPNGVITVELGRKTVAVFDVDGVLHALDDTCTHSGGPLSEGTVEAGSVICPWHGARFDLANGVATGELECPPLKTYTVREFDDQIEITSDE